MNTSRVQITQGTAKLTLNQTTSNIDLTSTDYAYTDAALVTHEADPTAHSTEISGAISTHNQNTAAHDIPNSISSAVSAHNSLATAHSLTANISAALSASVSPSSGNPIVTRSRLSFTNADDYASLSLAITATPNGGLLRLSANTTYAITDGNFVRRPISIVGGGRNTRIVLTTGGSVTCPTAFWFQSAFDTNSASLPYYGPVSTPTYYRTFSGSLTGGEHTFTLASTTGLSVGTNCMLLLGVDPYDATQPYVRQWNKVTNINGSSVTFAIPIPELINGTTHKCVTFDAIVENVRLSDLTIAYDGTFSQDQTIWFDKCRNVICENVYIERCTSGIVVESSENVLIQNVFCEKTDTGGFLSFFGAASSRAQNVGVLDCYGIALGFETQCRGVSIDTASIRRGPTASTGIYTINALGNSLGIEISNCTINHDNNSFSLNIGEGSQVITRNFYLYNDVRSFPLKQHEGFVRWNEVMYRDLRSWSVNYTIPPNANNVKLYIPNGIIKKFHVWIDNTTDLGTVYTIPGGDIAGTLVAGQAIDLGVNYTTLGDPGEFPFTTEVYPNRYFWFFSGSYAGGNMHIYMEYWPATVDDLATALIQSTQ